MVQGEEKLCVKDHIFFPNTSLRGNYKLYKHMPGQSYIAEKNIMDRNIPCNKHPISYIKNFMLFKVRVILLNFY